jgi:hypothetical protein
MDRSGECPTGTYPQPSSFIPATESPRPNWTGTTRFGSRRGVIACVTGSDLQVNNFTFRDIRIESPYLFRVFDFYNLDTNLSYTPRWFSPTSESRHTRLNGITLRDITINSPVIAYRSLLGSGYRDSFSNIRFINVRINGTIVSDENRAQFFQIEEDRVKGLKFCTETNSPKGSTKP